jgi:hypothetical protein
MPSRTIDDPRPVAAAGSISTCCVKGGSGCRKSPSGFSSGPPQPTRCRSALPEN